MFATQERGGGRSDRGGEAGELVRVLAGAWKFPCDERQVAGLAQYAASLLRWNERINLTAVQSIDTLVAEHFTDAFALALALEHPARAIDIGSGGGLPAIPLALLRAGLTVELVEPIAKKAAFLRTAIRELGLGDRVLVRVGRGEAVAQAIAKQTLAAFDVAMSRATLAPDRWLALGTRLVRPGGRVFALTAADALPSKANRRIYHGGRRALIEVRST